MTAIYCQISDVRRACGVDSTSVVSDTNITEFISDAEAEIDIWTGKVYTSTAATEYYEGIPQEISATQNIDEGVYFEIPREEKREILLDHYPVISITSLQWIDDDGTVNTSLTENTDYHLWNSTGKVWIFTKNLPYGDNKKKVKIVYTYGTSSVPRIVQRLASVIAGIHALVYQMGGTYNDVTSYSLPEGINISLGEPYTQLRETLNRLEKERDYLFNMIGREIPTVVV